MRGTESDQCRIEWVVQKYRDYPHLFTVSYNGLPTVGSYHLRLTYRVSLHFRFPDWCVSYSRIQTSWSLHNFCGWADGGLGKRYAIG